MFSCHQFQCLSQLVSKYLMFSLLAGLLFISCEEAAVVPLVGDYTGETVSVRFNFVEIFDNDGNMIGIRENRDTTITNGDIFSVSQVDKESAFTISGTGGLSTLNSFSNKKFTYEEGQNTFEIIEQTDGVTTLDVNIIFDGGGGVIIDYLSSNPDGNNRPFGTEIRFEGERQ